MDSLTDTTSGTYVVTTTHSTYLIDLDQMLVRRTPRTYDEEGALMRRDLEPITLLTLEDCTNGRCMELSIDLGICGVVFTSRLTTAVTSIRKVEPWEARE